jgi:hypothetical protein
LVRSSKIQISRIVFYWAVLTVAFAVFWTFFLNIVQLTGVGPALSLAVPVSLGGIIAIALYFKHDHQTLEYDDEGYRILRGKRNLEDHKWAEFMECSVVRDSYGRRKVRAYVERDGRHVEIDPSACGVDPYIFRDFMAERIRSVSAPYKESAVVGPVFDGLEKEIQRGRASWVADLSETFRGYQISGEMFPLIARGGTRPKGFLLSRFVAMTIMPNYDVCLYAHDIGSAGSEAKSRIMRLIRIIETQRDQKNIKWSWLLLFSDQEPGTSASRLIETFGNRDVGIGCIDVATGRIITSPNQLGKSLSNQMRFHRLMRDLSKRKRFGARA